MEISAIGVDLAKSVFQVHAVDGDHRVVLRQRLRRRDVLEFFRRLPPCLVGMEACATAHHWGRALRAQGHDVRLIPAQYVKAYVKRNKTDAADAAAICEAVTRPSMTFVPIKSREQQAALSVHGVRRQLIGQRTALINALRGHLAEFGLVAATGATGLAKLLELIDTPDLPAPLAMMLKLLKEQIESVSRAISICNSELACQHRDNAKSQRQATQPGVGVVLATALSATVTDPDEFKSGRQFAAWLGAVPQQASSGERVRLGRISKKGNEYLRRLFVSGALALIVAAKRRPDKASPWLLALLAKNKPTLVVALAVANKMARTAWAMMKHDTDFERGHQSSTPMSVTP